MKSQLAPVAFSSSALGSRPFTETQCCTLPSLVSLFVFAIGSSPTDADESARLKLTPASVNRAVMCPVGVHRKLYLIRNSEVLDRTLHFKLRDIPWRMALADRNRRLNDHVEDDAGHVTVLFY